VLETSWLPTRSSSVFFIFLSQNVKYRDWVACDESQDGNGGIMGSSLQIHSMLLLDHELRIMESGRAAGSLCQSAYA
jgi:hypothetical protein